MGVAAAGGGGGGGGGGATRNVINCVLGKASVYRSGMRIRTPSRIICKTNENNVVAPRLVLSLPPDSIRLSSNIRFSPTQTLRTLRHRSCPLCSRLLRLGQTSLLCTHLTWNQQLAMTPKLPDDGSLCRR